MPTTGSTTEKQVTTTPKQEKYVQILLNSKATAPEEDEEVVKAEPKGSYDTDDEGEGPEKANDEEGEVVKEEGKGTLDKGEEDDAEDKGDKQAEFEQMRNQALDSTEPKFRSAEAEVLRNQIRRRLAGHDANYLEPSDRSRIEADFKKVDTEVPPDEAAAA